MSKAEQIGNCPRCGEHGYKKFNELGDELLMWKCGTYQTRESLAVGPKCLDITTPQEKN